MEKYNIDANSYEEVRWKTLLAILESQLGIEISETAGMLHVSVKGKPLADISIYGENKK